MHEILIDALGTAGDGIGRLPSGEVVFVDGGLPGDLARIRLTRKVKRVQHAEVVEIIEPSSRRVESRCLVDACGGCPVRWFAREGQAEEKRDRVVQALRRIAGQDVDEMLGPVVQTGDGWGYRHRVRLHAAWIDDGWQLGYHARRSHRLVPLEECPVLHPELDAAARRLFAAVASLPRYAELQAADVGISVREGKASCRLQAAGDLLAFQEPLDWFEASGLAGVEVQGCDGVWRHGDLELRYDHARGDDFDLLWEPGVFTQANPSINDRLVDAVLAALPPERAPRILELHAGVGNYSLPLARAGSIVFTAEHQKRAVELAQRNAEFAGLTLHAHYLEDIDALSGDGPVPPLSDFDAVLLNPPRTGAFDVAKVLAKSGPATVTYVSCDPATLARDVKTLAAGGYRIDEAAAFDMLPQTPHVEVLLVLVR